ncbi:hypothetical protein ACFFIX_20930 [Metabacillus herbersteinensis]|uniref:Uncharacterized protein n=1 Tax=Metabacillus herbersteinensis TaxID=283816 RepID=A0ABV6GJV2_9BACI
MRKLNYVIAILKNWESELLLTAQEIDYFLENQKPLQKHRPLTESITVGRAIPSGFQLNLTAGEEV